MCGSMLEAEQTFFRLPKDDSCTWSAIILAHTKFGCAEHALKLYNGMHKREVEPADYAFNAALQACSSITTFNQGSIIHSHIVERSLESDVCLANTLINMYAKCGSLEDALCIFNNVSKPGIVAWSSIISGCLQGLFSTAYWLLCASEAYKVFWMLPRRHIQPWNAIITGSLQHGHFEDAISYFEGMQLEKVVADNTTYTSIIKACSDDNQVDMGALLFSLIIESSDHLNEVVGNALVSMYVKCGSLTDACRLFANLSKPDVVAWSAIVAGHVLHGFGQEALKFYCQMQLDGKESDNVTFLSALKACSLISALNQGRLIHVQVIDSEWASDVQVGNSLIDMYSKCGSLHDTLTVFYNLPTKTVITWNAVIAGLGHNNEYHRALEFFKVMQQEGLKPNDATFASLLSACNRLGLVHEGRLLFESLSLNHGVTPKVDHYVCLMECMSRAGWLTDAVNLVSILPFAPNLVTWTSLLSISKACGGLQFGKQASDSLITIDGNYASGYALMANFFADVNLLEDASNMQMLRKHAKAWKKPGQAFIEVNGKVYGFTVHDQSQHNDRNFSLKLQRLLGCLRKEDHMPFLDLVLCESCDRSGDS
ncbi:hypothetical protein GOP47_0014774 [Adiantum capillus-veneris]|uniref:Pentatricopeptide repeat-containing protein n=1 Tax=Adiantum capillus-veneris TaxID=13818 RepID=A0A9D4UM76_ADICA|nr:hypothetical protein GOP47_0014774 [Adiantum capillus-veneris]